jgi:uncharacterized membrane protein YfcA
VLTTAIILVSPAEQPDLVVHGELRSWWRWATAIGSIPGGYVAARLSLVLPATALDRTVTLRWSWGQTSSNGWRLFVVIGVLPWILSSLISWLYRENASIPEVAVILALSVLLMVMEIAAVSLSYSELSAQTEN